MVFSLYSLWIKIDRYLCLFNQMNENLQQSIKQSVNRRLVYEIHFHNPDENPSFSADTKPVSA